MLAKGRAMEVTMSFALLCHPRVPSCPRATPWLHPIKDHSPPRFSSHRVASAAMSIVTNSHHANDRWGGMG